MITGLKTIEDCSFAPGAGEPWQREEIFTMEEVLNPDIDVIRSGFFNIIFTEKNNESLKGEVVFSVNNLNLEGGEFYLDKDNTTFSTGSLNVSYATMLQMTLVLQIE